MVRGHAYVVLLRQDHDQQQYEAGVRQRVLSAEFLTVNPRILKLCQHGEEIYINITLEQTKNFNNYGITDTQND